MKKIFSLFIIVFVLILSVPEISAVTVGDESCGMFQGVNLFMTSNEKYLDYLAKLKKSRGVEYTSDQLEEIYNRISFYLINRQAIETDDEGLKGLLNSIMYVNIRNDDIYNCVEVVICNLSESKLELFKEYICDSGAVVVWNIDFPKSPENDPGSYAGVVDVDVQASPAWMKLKSGNIKPIPIANKSKVKQWKSSDSKVVSVKDGKLTALKKGKVTITAVYSSAVEVKLRYEVTDSPKLNLNGKTVTSITVKKKKSKTLKLCGKASTIKNKYKSTKKAKITSKNTSSTIKIKGLKKGKTTLKIKVNNSVTLSLKVKVK